MEAARIARARNLHVSFVSQPREHPFRRIADVKYDRAASKRRFHCSDSIDIERSFLPLFPRFPAAFFFLLFSFFFFFFLLFTRAAPLDCFPCPFQPASPFSPLSPCIFFQRASLLPLLSHSSLPLSLLFNHISVRLPRYTCTYTVV